jgi:hypothetical protein
MNEAFYEALLATGRILVVLLALFGTVWAFWKIFSRNHEP